MKFYLFLKNPMLFTQLILYSIEFLREEQKTLLYVHGIIQLSPSRLVPKVPFSMHALNMNPFSIYKRIPASNVFRQYSQYKYITLNPKQPVHFLPKSGRDSATSFSLNLDFLYSPTSLTLSGVPVFNSSLL